MMPSQARLRSAADAEANSSVLLIPDLEAWGRAEACDPTDDFHVLAIAARAGMPRAVAHTLPYSIACMVSATALGVGILEATATSLDANIRQVTATGSLWSVTIKVSLCSLLASVVLSCIMFKKARPWIKAEKRNLALAQEKAQLAHTLATLDERMLRLYHLKHGDIWQEAYPPSLVTKLSRGLERHSSRHMAVNVVFATGQEVTLRWIPATSELERTLVAFEAMMRVVPDHGSPS